LQGFAARAVIGALNDARSLACALGESLTEPKPLVWFDGGEPVPATQGARLDARSRMMYDDRHVFINGESFVASGRDAKLMRRLADQRALPVRELAQLSLPARELLDDWACHGWVHAH
jgi:50S ribosomal protein L16 3-hydroxylase